jgi:hypothetical protein
MQKMGKFSWKRHWHYANYNITRIKYNRKKEDAERYIFSSLRRHPRLAAGTDQALISSFAMEKTAIYLKEM